ncbi:hypothetical protein F5Y09DRAFT_309971 [Xylaria sp. FL1042]|nr:hypothetical protein F5Y09DRAFT_309971 [Xylaria sp. FL1042]
MSIIGFRAIDRRSLYHHRLAGGLFEQRGGPPKGPRHAGSQIQVFPLECIDRGYITDSVRKQYINKETIYGILLPQGLDECFTVWRNSFHA